MIYKSSLILISSICGLLYSANAADDVPPATAATKDPAAAGDGVQVGVARRDGITVTGGEIFVTRNGATEKLTKDLILPSGVIARPDGTILLPDKSQAALRSTQILGFDGKVMDIPNDPTVNPAPPAAAPRGMAPGGAMAASSGTMKGMAGGVGGSASVSAGSVFLAADGQPFMGILNTNGMITTADGRTIAADRSVRAVTFGNDGTPALGTVNANGTVTRADGASIFPDGSVRGANGVLMIPARAGDTKGNNAALNGNTNQTQQTNQAAGQNTDVTNPANTRPVTGAGTNSAAGGAATGNAQGGAADGKGAGGSGGKAGGNNSGGRGGGIGGGIGGAK